LNMAVAVNISFAKQEKSWLKSHHNHIMAIDKNKMNACIKQQLQRTPYIKGVLFFQPPFKVNI